ncbi:HYR domain-containing protein [Solirubrobacter soli]|uniref:HYR domain-containing protein n=1 Tax=Solirubrobacter soli TaxID=363832 RepID=UPI0004801CA1|nr:HYR domain-containing protein [Solirubrobacter soli]
MLVALGVLGAPSAASAETLVAWGGTPSAMSAVPAGDDYVAVAAGRMHAVALKRDGSLAAWGFTPTAVPAGNDFTAVAAGEDTSVALKRDGSVVTWGNPMAVAPAGSDYTAIATNGANIVALKRDGSLVATGWNGWNMTEVPAGNDFVAVSVELRHGVALRRDGSLAGWGLKTVGLPDPPDYTIVAPGHDYTAVAAGWIRGLALKRDGGLLAWTYNDWASTPVPPGNDFKAIATNANTVAALRQDGTLVSWGWAATPYTDVSVPNGAFTAVSAGPDYIVALKDTSPPSVTVPGKITAKATSSAGASVTYSASAVDAVAGPVAPTCSPASGSVFALGTTTVTCAATDSFANRGTASFPVVVGTAPRCSVKLASRKVRVARARVRITATCDQAGRVRLSGRNVKSATATLAAGRPTALFLKVSRRALASLRRGQRVTVAIALTMTTELGKAVARTPAVRLTPGRR